MAVDSKNWKREYLRLQKNFDTLKAENIQLRESSNKVSLADSVAEFSALKEEVSNLRADINSLIEIVKNLSSNNELTKRKTLIAQIIGIIEHVKNLSSEKNNSAVNSKEPETINIIDNFNPSASITTKIKNRLTGTFYPESLLVKTASEYRCKIRLSAKGKTLDAKSILMLMSMGLTKGTEVTILADGPEADEAVNALKKLIDDDNIFGKTYPPYE